MGENVKLMVSFHSLAIASSGKAGNIHYEVVEWCWRRRRWWWWCRPGCSLVVEMVLPPLEDQRGGGYRYRMIDRQTY